MTRIPALWRDGRWLLLLPALCYFLVAREWRLQGTRPQGDEPHYLVLAESLARDGDLDVANNYVDTALLARIAGGPIDREFHAEEGPHGVYSRHAPGLPVLIALPWRLGGVAAVRGFLALVAGCVPFLIEAVLFATLGSRLWSISLALVLSLGLPFAAAAGEIYPDLPTGILVFALFLEVTALWSGPPRRPWRLALGAAGLAFLPWLHLKNLAPFAILLAGGIAAFARRREAAVAVAWSALPVASVGALLAWGHHAFGGLGIPYGGDALTFEPRRVAMILLGLHFDQAQGLFCQQPLFLLGLLGLWPFARRQPVQAAALASLYASLIVPNAMHVNWYGGVSFAGRFGWSSVLLWVFPAAFGARLVLGLAPSLLAFAEVASLVLQWQHAALWLRARNYLLQTGMGAALWVYRGLYPRASTALPFYNHFDGWALYPPNVCAELGAIGVVFLGAALGSGRRQTAAWLGAGLLLLPPLAYLGRSRERPPLFADVCARAADLPRSGWSDDAALLPAVAGAAGSVVELRHGIRFGPYLSVPPGHYRFVTRLSATTGGGARLDVVSGALGPLAERTVSAAELPPAGAWRLYSLPFDLPQWVSDLELRTANAPGGAAIVREDWIGLFGDGRGPPEGTDAATPPCK